MTRENCLSCAPPDATRFSCSDTRLAFGVGSGRACGVAPLPQCKQSCTHTDTHTRAHTCTPTCTQTGQIRTGRHELAYSRAHPRINTPHSQTRRTQTQTHCSLSRPVKKEHRPSRRAWPAGRGGFGPRRRHNCDLFALPLPPPISSLHLPPPPPTPSTPSSLSSPYLPHTITRV